MIIIEAREDELSRATLARFLAAAQRQVKLQGQVNVLITTSDELRRLNAEFRGQDQPTDVLSFPASDGFGGNGDGAKLAGELAISACIAADQARGHGHDLTTEVKVLMLHGLLHLAGYDHETDSGEMRTLEDELRSELDLPVGLIARTTHGQRSAQSTQRTARSPRATTPVRRKLARRPKRDPR